MENLENYGVVSLDSREMKEIDGGFILLMIAYNYAFLAVAGAGIYASFEAGYQQA